jgi:hypothetical protein
MELLKYRMKPILILFLMSLGMVNAGAQDTNMPPPPMPPPPPPGGEMAGLTKEECARLKAAHDKAIQQDPSLDQKIKEAHQALEEAKKALVPAMIKADPSVEPLLAKIAPKWGPRHEWKNALKNANPASTDSPATNGVTPDMSKPERHGMPPGFANLSPSEQAQLKAIHEQVKNDPAVIAAKQATSSASNPEERKAAKDALHQVMRDAMIKADPSVAPLLEKIHP